MVVAARCPNLCREFNRFKKKTINGYITDEGNRRGNCHAIETLEYAAANGLKYVKPKVKRKHTTFVQQVLHQRKRRSAARKARARGPNSGQINLGPQGG